MLELEEEYNITTAQAELQAEANAHAEIYILWNKTESLELSQQNKGQDTWNHLTHS